MEEGQDIADQMSKLILYLFIYMFFYSYKTKSKIICVRKIFSFQAKIDHYGLHRHCYKGGKHILPSFRLSKNFIGSWGGRTYLKSIIKICHIIHYSYQI